ncbi:MAG: insulinase family protein [Myxococcota bacterium]
MSALDRAEAHECAWFVPDDTLPMCRFAVVFNGGGASDPAGASGAHRAMSELVLRGTESLRRDAFHARLERYGSMLYAQTFDDALVFRGSCLSRHLAATLDLLAEALCTPALDQREAGTLLDEIRDGLEASRDDDEHVAALWSRRALFRGTPYATSAAGEVGELDRITVDGLRAVHRRRILEGGFSVVAVGSFEREHFFRFVERLGARSLAPPTPMSFPDPVRPRVVLVHQPEREQVQLRIGRLTLEPGDPELLAFWLASTAFAGTFTSPFCQQVREQRGLSYTAHVQFSSYRSQRAPWVLHSAPSLADVVECLTLELDLYRGAADGLSDSVIEFARGYLLNRHPLSIASANDLLYPLVRLALLQRAPSWIASIPSALAAIDCESARDALRRHLDPDRFVVTLTGSVETLNVEVAGADVDRVRADDTTVL